MERSTNYLEVLSCGVARWNLIWGDPILSGSILMTSYALTAILMFLVARQSEGKERWLWLLCGLLFLFQVFNTPLDLHAFPGAVGHCLAIAQGWYEQRGPFKLLVLIGLAGCAALMAIVLLVVFYRNIAGNILLIVGVAIVVVFTLAKGIGYKEAEQVYGVGVGPFRIADFIEFSGVLVAMIAALQRKLRQF